MPSKSKRKVTVDNSKDGNESGSRRQSVFSRLGSNAVIPTSQTQEGNRHARQQETEKCRNWMRTGICGFGSACRFEHTNYSGSNQQRKNDRAINEKDLRHKVRNKRKASRTRDEKSPPSSPKKSKSSTSSSTGGSSSRKSEHTSDSKIKSTVVVTRQRSPHSEADPADKDAQQTAQQPQSHPPSQQPPASSSSLTQATQQPKEWEDDDWLLDASQLDYKEELTLEIKRQQLQRELELELQKEKMMGDVTITKPISSRSAGSGSQSTSSETSSSGVTSSSSSSSGSSSGSSSSSTSSGDDSEGDSESSSTESSSDEKRSSAKTSVIQPAAGKSSRSSKLNKKSSKEGTTRDSDLSRKSESSSRMKSSSQRSKVESVSSFATKKSSSVEPPKSSKGSRKHSKDRDRDRGRDSRLGKHSNKNTSQNETTSGDKDKSSRYGSRHGKQWQSGSEDPDRSVSKNRRHKKKKNHNSKTKDQGHRNQGSSIVQSSLSPSRHSSSSSVAPRKRRQDIDPPRDKYSEHHADSSTSSRDHLKSSHQRSSRHGRSPSPPSSHNTTSYSESKDYSKNKSDSKRSPADKNKSSIEYEDRHSKKGKKPSPRRSPPKSVESSRHRDSQPNSRDTSRTNLSDRKDRQQGSGDRRRDSPSPPLRDPIRDDSRRLPHQSRQDSPKKHGNQKGNKGRPPQGHFGDMPSSQNTGKQLSGRHSPEHRQDKSHQDKGQDNKRRTTDSDNSANRNKRKNEPSSSWDSRKMESQISSQPSFPLRDRHGNLIPDRKSDVAKGGGSGSRDRSRSEPDKEHQEERRVRRVPTPTNEPSKISSSSSRDYGRQQSPPPPPPRMSSSHRGQDQEKGKSHKGDGHIPPSHQMTPPPSQHSRPTSPTMLPAARDRDRDRGREPHYVDSHRDRGLDYPGDPAPLPLPPVRDFSPDRYPDYRYPPPRDHPEHDSSGSRYRRGKDYDLPPMLPRDAFYSPEREMLPDHDPYPYHRDDYLYQGDIHPAEEWDRYRGYPSDHDMLSPLMPPYRGNRGDPDHMPMERYRGAHPADIRADIRREEEGGRLLDRHPRGRSPDWPRRDEHWDAAQSPAAIGGHSQSVDNQRSKSPVKTARDRSPESHGSWDRGSNHGSLGSEGHGAPRNKDDGKQQSQSSQWMSRHDRDKATSKKGKDRNSRKRSCSGSPQVDSKRPRPSRDSKDYKDNSNNNNNNSNSNSRPSSKDSRDHKNARDQRDFRESKDYRDSRDSKDNKREDKVLKDNRDSKDLRENKDLRDREMREPREMKDNRSVKESRDSKDIRESKENRETRDGRESRDSRDLKESRDTKEREPKDVKEHRDSIRDIREGKELKEAREDELKESRDLKESKDTRKTKEGKKVKDSKDVGEAKDSKDISDNKMFKEPKDGDKKVKQEVDSESSETKEVKIEEASSNLETSKDSLASPVSAASEVKGDVGSPEPLSQPGSSPYADTAKMPERLFVKDDVEENFSDWTDDDEDDILTRDDLDDEPVAVLNQDDFKEKDVFKQVDDFKEKDVGRSREHRDRSRESSSSRSRRSRSSDGRNSTDRSRDDYRSRKETTPIKEEKEDDTHAVPIKEQSNEATGEIKNELEDIDYDPISDDDLEAMIEEPDDDKKPVTQSSEKSGLTDVLGVDWASLVAESKPKPKVGSARQRFLAANVLGRIGFSQAWAGPELSSKVVEFCSKQLQDLAKDEEKTDKTLEPPVFTLHHPVATLHVATYRQRQNLLQQFGPFRRALSARHDLQIRKLLARGQTKLTSCSASSVSYSQQTNIDKDLFKLSVELFRKSKLPQKPAISVT